MTIKNHSSNFIKNNRGLSLVELLIALFLLGIVLLTGASSRPIFSRMPGWQPTSLPGLPV